MATQELIDAFAAEALSDPKKQLKGSGKQTRFIPLQDACRLDDPDVQGFISATVAQSAIPFPTHGEGRLVIMTDSANKRPRKAAPKSST